jgi:hypothetical protein
MPKVSLDTKSEDQFLLLLEGTGDCHAIDQIVWYAKNRGPHFGFHQCENDDGILRSIAGRIVENEPRQKAIGLVLDADIDGHTDDTVIAARLDQLRDKIGTRYEVPQMMPSTGLVLVPRQERPDAGKLPNIGLWMMPDNKVFGMLEDVLLASLSDHARVYTEEVVKKAKTDTVATYHDSHVAKAVVRTYIAWQEPPDLQFIGLAIRKGLFNKIPETCAGFLQWLEDLFGPFPHSQVVNSTDKQT